MFVHTPRAIVTSTRPRPTTSVRNTLSLLSFVSVRNTSVDDLSIFYNILYNVVHCTVHFGEIITEKIIHVNCEPKIAVRLWKYPVFFSFEHRLNGFYSITFRLRCAKVQLFLSSSFHLWCAWLGHLIHRKITLWLHQFDSRKCRVFDLIK